MRHQFRTPLAGLALVVVAGPASAESLQVAGASISVLSAVSLFAFVGLFRLGQVLATRRRRRFNVYRRLMHG